jgi:SAM-dependent methyltransferase
MPATAYRRKDCRLCNGTNLTLVLPLAPTPIADDYVPASRRGEPQERFPLDLFLCRDCGHTQLLDVVSPVALFSDYTYVTAVSLGLVEHFRSLAELFLARYAPPAGSFVAEIGSNDGTLLRFFQERGLRVLGIDRARETAPRASASGVETLPEFFTSALAARLRAERGPAAVVIANNVFAHADGLGDIADGIRALLAGDGVFEFEVSYMVDIVDKMLFDTIFHEHLCYHAVKPMRSFLARHGLELIDIQRIPTKGGSIRGFAQPAGGPRPVAPVVGELVALEDGRRFDQPEPFFAFGARIEAAKRALLEVIEEFRRAGKTVAGYGASATVTTLLHHFELGDKLAFIVDDNPVKQGTFSPGHHIPIYPAGALSERRPDAVVILAWAYTEPIVKKNQAYLEAGGRFIVPLPEIRVI